MLGTDWWIRAETPRPSPADAVVRGASSGGAASVRDTGVRCHGPEPSGQSRRVAAAAGGAGATECRGRQQLDPAAKSGDGGGWVAGAGSAAVAAGHGSWGSGAGAAGRGIEAADVGSCRREVGGTWSQSGRRGWPSIP